jgi:hypothetical protein
MRDARLAALIGRCEEARNHEAFSPPFYYLLAGGWYQVGKWLGLADGRLVYWGRFFNVPVYVALVLTAYLFCRRYYAGHRFLRLSVPLLLAFLPQDVFYCYSCDVLPPLLFLGAVALMLEWCRRGPSAIWPGAAAGALVALTFLTRYTDIAVGVLFSAVLVRQAFLIHRATRWRHGWIALLGALTAAGLPVLGWLLRNQLVLGDPLGTQAKIEQLHWSRKPLGELGQHPLFTLQGFSYFGRELLERFWRGEVVWHRATAAGPWAGHYFVWSSAILLGAAAFCWFVRRRQDLACVHRADGLALTSVGLSVLVLAVLSLVFDFGDCPYPSRAQPYFVSGRLISGLLVPFFVLYVRGLEWLFARVARVAGPAVVVGTAAIMVSSRLELLLRASGSLFNWFHLP